MATTSTLSARIDARIDARVQAAWAAGKAQALEPIKYEIDSKGRMVRKGTMTRWTTPEEIREFLIGNRVVEEDDALYHIGPNCWRTLIQQGLVKKDPKATYYWITAACAQKYDLPRVMGCAWPK